MNTKERITPEEHSLAQPEDHISWLEAFFATILTVIGLLGPLSVLVFIDFYWKVPVFFLWMLLLFPGVCLRFVVFKQASYHRRAGILAAIVAFSFLVLFLWAAFEPDFISNMDPETAWILAAPLAKWILAPSLATYAVLRYDPNRLGRIFGLPRGDEFTIASKEKGESQ